MSKRINWDGNLSSIKSFFKYTVSVWKMNNIHEQEIKTKDLYAEYVDFCNTVDMDYFSIETFGRVLTSLGVESKVAWERGNALKMKRLSLNSMLQIILDYEEPFFATSQIVPLQGKMYLMTIRLKEVQVPLNEEPLPEVQEVINKDNFNNYVQRDNNNEQQPSSSTAGGDSCEA
jgi:hypothetical protein